MIGGTMDVTIVHQPELRVAAQRHVGPYDQIGQTFQKLYDATTRAGFSPGPEVKLIALYHDDPRTTPADQLRSDAGIILPEGAAIPVGAAEQRVPAGRYAKTVHAGGYENLPNTWRTLMGEWLPKSGHRSASRSNYEIYLNTPMETPKDQLRTEIYAAIE
jgi:AraC family transcriptional regulator